MNSQTTALLALLIIIILIVIIAVYYSYNCVEDKCNLTCETEKPCHSHKAYSPEIKPCHQVKTQCETVCSDLPEDPWAKHGEKLKSLGYH